MSNADFVLSFCSTTTNVSIIACGTPILKYLILATSIVNFFLFLVWVKKYGFDGGEMQGTSSTMRHFKNMGSYVNGSGLLVKFIYNLLLFLDIGVAQEQGQRMYSEIYVAIFLCLMVISMQYLLYALLTLSRPIYQNFNHFLLRGDMLFVKIWSYASIMIFIALTIFNVVFSAEKATYLAIRMIRFSLLAICFISQSFFIHIVLKIIKNRYGIAMEKSSKHLEGNKDLALNMDDNTTLKIRYERVVKISEFGIVFVTVNGLALIGTFVICDVYLEKSIVYQVIKLVLDWLSSFGLVDTQGKKGEFEVAVIKTSVQAKGEITAGWTMEKTFDNENPCDSNKNNDNKDLQNRIITFTASGSKGNHEIE